MTKLRESVDGMNQSTTLSCHGSSGRSQLQASGMGESSIAYHPPPTSAEVSYCNLLKLRISPECFSNSGMEEKKEEKYEDVLRNT